MLCFSLMPTNFMFLVFPVSGDRFLTWVVCVAHKYIHYPRTPVISKIKMTRTCNSSPWEMGAGSGVQGQAGLLEAETGEGGKKGRKGKKNESYWFYLIF